jgi:cyclophilin family peptidyl-prolyl cis-trans isomerase
MAYARDVAIPSLVTRDARPRRLVVLTCLALSLAGCTAGNDEPAGRNPKVPAGARSSGGLHAVIETDKGAIEIEFLPADAPKAVENFRLLAEHGYYDGLTFHRIVKGFMIQGGDPSGDGTGGESAWGGTFEDEIKQDSPLYRGGYRRGLVAMANAGPDTNGSQFFINDADSPWLTADKYTIFGHVKEGQEIVKAIANAERDGNDRPKEEIKMQSVTVEEK